MTTALAGAVELLDRSLGYTRVVLSGVRPDLLDRPTPCRAWDLRQLLAHMEDALDAFTEAATGRIDVVPTYPRQLVVERLRDKACALLGLWSSGAPPEVRVGEHPLGSDLLAAAAALEITVHGWDVGQALHEPGAGPAIPEELAAGLEPVARFVVQPIDRGHHFGDPVRIGSGAAPDERLLGFLGRALPEPVA